MANFTVMIDGVPTLVPIPDGLSTGGAQDYLIQSGFDADQVGLDLPEPDPIPLGMQTLIGAGEFVSDLFQSLQSPIRAPDTLAADIGRVAATTPALAAPSARLGGMAAQGAISAGLEVARQRAAGEGIADIDLQSAAGQGAFTVAIMSGFNAASRVTSGIATRVAARVNRRPISLPRRPGRSQEAERFASGAARMVRGSGALSAIETAQRRANNFAWGKAMGFPTRDARRIAVLDEDTLGAARQIIDRTYDAAAPTGAVSVKTLKPILDELKESGLPDAGLNNVIRLLKNLDEIDPSQWQGVQRTLRDVGARVRRNPTFSGLSDDVTRAIDNLDELAVAAGGDKALLTQANHRYKLLANTEELTDILLTGQIPIGSELLRKLTRENFKGFGRRGVLEGKLKVDPDLQNFFDVQREIGKFARETAGGSPTAARMASIGQAQKAAVEGITGTRSPAMSAFKAVVSLGLPPLMALMAIGESAAFLSRVGVPFAQGIPKILSDEVETDELTPDPAIGN